MLTIMLQGDDEQVDATLNLEHSLASVSKWESVEEKPFFGSEQKTSEETISYIKLMVVGDPPPGDWVERLQVADFSTITDYINSKQSATWFREDPNPKPSREVVTSELVYYWMTQFNIPFDPCENWHLNRLMTLIKISGIKQTKPQKMDPKKQLQDYARLNAQRRQQLGTSG